jgi:hypothetical protein
VFVGRDADVAELVAAADAVASGGSGRLVLVAGEAGIGKTALVDRAATAAGLPATWASCWEGDGAPAFWPWSQVLRGLLEGDRTVLDRIGAGGDDVALLLPGRVAEAEAPGSTADARFRMFEAVAAVLREMTRDHARIVILDDLHWADRPSLRLLSFVARELRSTRALVVGTYRDTDVGVGHPLLEVIGDLAGTGAHLTLRGLAEADIAELLVALLDDPAAGDMARDVHRHTGGNPFFAHEVIRLQRSTGMASRPTGGVRAVVTRRLARLSNDCHATLRLAAVIGIEFPADLLEAASGSSREELLSHLDEATSSGLIAPDPDRVGLYAFAHAVVRETIESDLGAGALADMHSRIARALEARHGDDPDRVAELAHHFTQAASGGIDIHKAVEYSTRAGDEAVARLAHESAAERYEAALAVRRSGPSDPEGEARLLLTLGDARWAAGDPNGARGAFEEAARIGRRLDRSDLLAHAAIGLSSGLAGFEVSLLDYAQIDLLEEALAALPVEDAAARVAVLGRLSVALSFVAPTARRLELANAALAMARRLGEPRALGYALAGWCDAVAGPDHCATRRSAASEIVHLGVQARDPQLELLGRRLLVVALFELGELVVADAEIDAYARVAEMIRQPRYRWFVPLWRATRALTVGDFARAEMLTREAETIGALVDSENAAVLTAVQDWVRLRYLRRVDEALELFDSRLTGPLGDLPSFSAMQAMLDARDGELDAARQRTAALVAAGLRDTRDSEWLPELASAAEMARVLGMRDTVAAAFELLLPYADVFLVEGIGAGVVAPTAELLALLARSMGRDREADELSHRASQLKAAAGVTVSFPPVIAAAGAAAEPLGPADEGELRLEGYSWRVIFAGRSATVRDSKGMRDLATLLATPGRGVPAVALAGAVATSDDAPALDATALAAYKQRLLDLDDDLAEADAHHDVERSARLAAERDALVAELTSAVGLGGRARRPGDPGERARKAVAARIRDAIGRVHAVHPVLGRHLAHAVKTGTFCAYEPEHPVVWQCQTTPGASGA